MGALHHALALLRKLEPGEANILHLDKPALQPALIPDAERRSGAGKPVKHKAKKV